jgi:hypothetical protein
LIDDKLKIAFSFLRTPSYPGVARRHHPGGTGKLQTGEIAAGQLTGFDEVTKAGAERNAVFQVMVTVDVLLKQRIKLPVGSLNQMQRQAIEIAGTPGDRGLSVAVRSADDVSRPGRSRRPETGQDQNAPIPEMFEKSAALFVLELPRRPFPLEKLADGFGQFRQAQIGEIADNPTDEFKVGYGEGAAGKSDLQWLHGGSPLLLLLPYLKRRRMSREKCNEHSTR